jgi:hypothetical protein
MTAPISQEQFESELRKHWPNICLNKLHGKPDEYALSQVDMAWKIVRDLSTPAAPQRQPDGYAYRYPGPYGGLRFNSGQEVNGSRPTESVPYFLGSAPAQIEASKKSPPVLRDTKDVGE